MNIALVIQHADVTRGGAERYTADLAAALAGRRHRVVVLAQHFGTWTQACERVELSAGGLGRAGRYRRLLNGLDAHLAGHRHDLVHAMLPVRSCDVYHPHAGLAAEELASGHFKHRTPLRRMIGQWGTRFNGRRQALARIEARLLSRPNPPFVLCLSDYVRRSIQRHYPLPANKLPTLFNAVDLLRFNPAWPADSPRERFGLAPDAVVALLIAQDFARKGLDLAIRSLQGNQATLLVAGRDNPRPYRRLADSLGVAERVIFAGALADPTEAYRAADFFVLPTRHDPCSLVVLEALAMGLPVITTHNNGAAEIMRDGMHGFVIDSENIAVLTRGMSQLAGNKNLRDTMRAACLALRPELSWDRHVDHLEEIYGRHVSNRAGQAKAAARR